MKELVSKPKWFFSQIDWILVLFVVALCSASALALYSAGYNQSLGESPEFNRHIFSLSVGFVALLIGSLFGRGFWLGTSYPFYCLGCLSLIAVLLSGNSVVAGGARRWIELGGFRFQPSEFIKIVLILALARFLSSQKMKRHGQQLFDLFVPSVLIAVPSILILLQPDLGTALCHMLIGGSMLLFFGIHKRTIFGLGIFGLVSIYPAWLFLLHDYQKRRVLTFFSPESDPLGSGYHAIQSKIAVGSGGVFGKGFMEGTQTQLRFLPEQTTDFIFSVWAEEWGFAGSFLVLIVYGLLVVKLIMLSSQTTDRFAGLVSIGIASLIFWQVVVNIGMVTGVMPVVGLTLPLFSYGGSSLVSVMAGIGMVLGLSRTKKNY